MSETLDLSGQLGGDTLEIGRVTGFRYSGDVKPLPLTLYGPGGRRTPGHFVMVGGEWNRETGELSYKYRHVRPGTFYPKRRTRSMRGK